LTADGYDRAFTMTDRIGETLSDIFERSDAEDVATNIIANRIALDRIEVAQKRSKGGN
jgi:hypothetical protein